MTIRLHLQLSPSLIRKKARATPVLAKDHGGWKITREHLAALNPVTDLWFGL